MEDIISANKQLNEWCGTEGINFYEGDTALGFLFKYAVPKLPTGEIEIWDSMDILLNWLHKVLLDEEDPSLALFRVIYKALGGK